MGTPAPSGDTEAPVLNLTGNATSTLNIRDSYVDPGATVVDNVDQNLGVTTTGSVDTSTAGVYTLYYDATDSAGNKAIQLSRVVTIVDPSQVVPTPPVEPVAETPSEPAVEPAAEPVVAPVDPPATEEPIIP